MPKKMLFTVIVFAFLFKNINAQQIDSILNIYANQFTPEKIHLHIDRSVYKAGDDIFYKAYVMRGNEPSTLSTTLYVDWYDASGKLLQQTEAPLLLSGAKGSFEIPKDYTGSLLHIKAYTKWMLNFDSAFIYDRSVNIYHSSMEQTKPSGSATIINLYPEGGFSIAGLINRFAFKATDQTGAPVYIKGAIKDNQGQLLDSVKTIHDGMGSFNLLTALNTSYYFDWIDEHGKTGTKEIKADKENGVSLQVKPQNEKAFFAITKTSATNTSFNIMHLLIHQNEALHFKLDINMSLKSSLNSEILLRDLPPGIVQFTLFNNDWIPIAERIIFVNNNDRSFEPLLSLTKKDLSKKGRNEVTIDISDTLVNNMSLAIIDEGMYDSTSSTIFSDFLLSDELKGKINNPAYYFADNIEKNELTANLDLLMLTQGHRRFDWDKIAKNELPSIKYTADINYLQIKGNLKKSKDQSLLNIILLTKDSSKSVFVIPVQKDGSFLQENMFYYDTVKLFYSLNGKNNISGNISFENTLLNKKVRSDLFKTQIISKLNDLTYSKDLSGQIDSLFAAEINLEKLKASTTLKEVVVTTKVKTQIQLLDEYYSSGFYAGEGNNYPIDVDGDINSRSYTNIFNYLQSRVPGFHVDVLGNPVWYPDSRGIPSVPAFLLDEVPISQESVTDLSISAIAYVKAFRPPFLGTMLNGFSGVIAIYSKRGYSPVYSNTDESGLASTILTGYTKFKEFTQPTFSADEADYRPTLYWNPFVLTDKNNQHINIQFTNNDLSKKFYIILEGVRADGKMTRIVKLIE